MSLYTSKRKDPLVNDLSIKLLIQYTDFKEYISLLRCFFAHLLILESVHYLWLGGGGISRPIVVGGGGVGGQLFF